MDEGDRIEQATRDVNAKMDSFFDDVVKDQQGEILYNHYIVEPMEKVSYQSDNVRKMSESVRRYEIHQLHEYILKLEEAEAKARV